VNWKKVKDRVASGANLSANLKLMNDSFRLEAETIPLE
jgi:hypothetical protein